MSDDDSPARPRGVFWLPNLLTTGALFAGFYAIVAAIDLRFEYAGIAVFVAMLFDGLDGRVARWTNTASAFGKEYDSLSDMVSFGVAPAIVTYQWGVARIRVRPSVAPCRMAGLFFLCGGSRTASGTV
jgi:CDP-diacylglycerol--serine O-phosphatidyltransferase